MRKWIQIIMVGLVVAGISYTPVFGQPHMGMGRPGPGGAMGDGPGMFLPMLLRGIDLTADQRTQVRAIMDSYRSTFPALFKQLHEAHEALATILLTPGEVDAKVLAQQLDSVTQIRAQLLQKGTDVMLAVRQILTADQLAQAAQIKTRLQALHDEMHSLMHGNLPDSP